MPRYCYFAHSLFIHSDIPIDAFVEADGDCDCDLLISKSDGVLTDSAPDQKNCVLRCDENEAVVYHHEVGRLIAINGREIVLELIPDPSPIKLRYLIASVMLALVLYQRGSLVLHASAVEFDGRTLALAGWPGAGKSTLAAALYSKGCGLVADDVCSIHFDGYCSRVSPSYPTLKVNETIAEWLGLERDVYGHHRLDARRQRNYCPSEVLAQTGYPLRGIYLISEGEEHRIELLGKREALTLLLRHCMPTQIGFPGGQIQLFQLAELVRRVPVFSLKRSKSLEHLDAHATAVELHFKKAIGQIF